LIYFPEAFLAGVFFLAVFLAGAFLAGGLLGFFLSSIYP